MKKPFLFLSQYFLIISGVCVIAQMTLLHLNEIENWLFGSVNLILFVSGFLILTMQKKALESGNPHAFVRSVMGGILLKMILFMGMVVGYAIAFRNHINQVLVIASILLYLCYLIAEVTYLMKLNKK